MNVKRDLDVLSKVEYKAKQALVGNEECSLQIFKNKQSLQFCKIVDGKRIYLSKKHDREIICRMAQMKYAKELLQIVEKLKKSLNSFSRDYSLDLLNKVYDQMPEELKTYVVSYTPVYEEYGEQWAHKEYRKKNSPENKNLKTENGECVRSKSELIIANKLKEMGLKYRYEAAHLLKGYGVVYPDFTILDPKTNEEIILEHFGMMDNEEYLDKSFLGKLALYAENGIAPGKGLICTFETSTRPLDTDNLEKELSIYFSKLH